MSNQSQDHILYLHRRDVEFACQEIDGLDVIRELSKLHAAGETILPDEAYLGWENDRGETVRSLNMPGYVGGSFRMAGTKIINGNVSNPRYGLPRASGITLLFDNTSVRVMCMMESAYISSLRTAYVTALAADVLKGPDIECVAIISADVLAQAHVRVLLKNLPSLQYVSVYDVDQERISIFKNEIENLMEGKGVRLHIAPSSESAIKDAQLIVPVTTTTEGYIPFAWLQPGSLLVNISLEDPMPEVVLRADKVFVDDWSLVKQDSRRLLGRMYRARQITGPDEEADNQGECRRIDGELGEVINGTKEGREHNSDIILLNPFGMAIEDVAFAVKVYQAARKLGLGTALTR